MYLTINSHYTATVRDENSIGKTVEDYLAFFEEHNADENFGRMVIGMHDDDGDFINLVKEAVLKFVDGKLKYDLQETADTNKWRAVDFSWWYKSDRNWQFGTWANAQQAIKIAKQKMLKIANANNDGVHKYKTMEYLLMDLDKGEVDEETRTIDEPNKRSIQNLVDYATENGIKNFTIEVGYRLDWWPDWECYFKYNQDTYEPTDYWTYVVLYRSSPVLVNA